MATYYGFILLMPGIVGEYFGRIGDESKSQPMYIVDKLHGSRARKPQVFRWLGYRW